MGVAFAAVQGTDPVGEPGWVATMLVDADGAVGMLVEAYKADSSETAVEDCCASAVGDYAGVHWAGIEPRLLQPMPTAVARLGLLLIPEVWGCLSANWSGTSEAAGQSAVDLRAWCC